MKIKKIATLILSSLLSLGAMAQKKQVITETVNGVSFNMVYVKGGTFNMGAQNEKSYEDNYDPDATSNESPVHSVTLSNYYIGETEVTQELWEAVMGTTIESQCNKAEADWNEDCTIEGKGDKYPMFYVSWDDCQNFITKLNRLTGKNYSLPTEAQWEYAARGGENHDDYIYSGSNNIEDVAWYSENAEAVGAENPDYGSHPVATKKANSLGIYDMSGNVWEWCSDWIDIYPSSSQTDPTGPTEGTERISRGGSWHFDKDCSRVSYRRSDESTARYTNFGFRLALAYDEAPSNSKSSSIINFKSSSSVDPNVSSKINDVIKGKIKSPKNQQTIIETVNGVSFNMIYVRGGTFNMGAQNENSYNDNYDPDAASNESPVHSITLSDYYIGETEVTQELWEAVMGTTIESQCIMAEADWNENCSIDGKGDKYPMFYVSWDDCQNFITKLNRLTGKNYSLPTEAQWEYAARGGENHDDYIYSGSNNIEDVAWYSENAEAVGAENPDYGSHPVATKKANSLGIYDMSGNVWEWCSDWIDIYPSSSQTDPTGPTEGTERISRGGSWHFDKDCSRVSYRRSDESTARYTNFGFRLVLRP